jgi:hypothetical protein
MSTIQVSLGKKTDKPMKSESSGLAPLSFLYSEVSKLLREDKNFHSLMASILNHANSLRTSKEVNTLFTSLEDEDNDNHPLGDEISAFISQLTEDVMQYSEGLNKNDPALKSGIIKGLKPYFKQKPSDALLNYFATLDY